jgi:hypothetical protein
MSTPEHLSKDDQILFGIAYLHRQVKKLLSQLNVDPARTIKEKPAVDQSFENKTNRGK